MHGPPTSVGRSGSGAWLWAASLSLLALGCTTQRPLLYEGLEETVAVPLTSHLVQVRDGGLVPAQLPPMRKGTESVAFLNDTRDRYLSIVFPDDALSQLRCSYTNGFVAESGATYTGDPIPPGGVVSLCLHDAGRIPFEVHGLAGGPIAGLLRVAGAGPEHAGPGHVEHDQ